MPTTETLKYNRSPDFIMLFSYDTMWKKKHIFMTEKITNIQKMIKAHCEASDLGQLLWGERKCTNSLSHPSDVFISNASIPVLRDCLVICFVLLLHFLHFWNVPDYDSAFSGVCKRHGGIQGPDLWVEASCFHQLAGGWLGSAMPEWSNSALSQSESSYRPWSKTN